MFTIKIKLTILKKSDPRKQLNSFFMNEMFKNRNVILNTYFICK